MVSVFTIISSKGLILHHEFLGFRKTLKKGGILEDLQVGDYHKVSMLSHPRPSDPHHIKVTV